MDLLEFWKQFNPISDNKFVHPLDYKTLATVKHKTLSFISWQQLVNDHQDNRKSLITDLSPQPFLGDLKNAKVYLLMLNPGYSYADHYAEQNSEELRLALEKNLNQDFGNNEYPLFYLDPNFAWHGGAKYWRKALKDYVTEISNSKKLNHTESLKYLSQRVAVLELFPYRSSSFGSHSLINKLPSSQSMIRWANQLIKREDHPLVVVMRGSRYWNLNESFNNVISLSKGEARGASISKTAKNKERVFDVLIKRLKDDT